MTDTTAKIRSKGLDGTGFTEDLAASLFDRIGHNLKAIVELQVVDKHGPNLDGKRGIDLVITHLRELTRTLHYNRGLDGHVGTTTEGQERTVADVLASGGKHKPHPFLPVDAADENPICDVCGVVEVAGPHTTQDLLDNERDEDDNEQDDPNDYDGEPHVYIGGPEGDTGCLTCDEAEDAPIHRDGADIDASLHGDDEPWEYDAPEGTKPTVTDPFTTPTPA